MKSPEINYVQKDLNLGLFNGRIFILKNYRFVGLLGCSPESVREPDNFGCI